MIIREFVTKLGFDADESKVKSFDRAVSGLRTGLLAAVGAMTAVATAAGLLVTETARYGDEAAKTARTLGMTAEGLQGLRFAFGRVGVEQSELTNGLERLSRNLGQAARGEETARKGFDALGISIFDADGKLRQINELMPSIVEGLNNVEGEAQSAAIAADLFGRSGIRLGRAMRQGSGELEALIDEYERLGGGLTNEQAEEAEAFTDALTNMSVVIQGIRLQVGARLMPVLRPMVEAFTAFMVANREIITTRIEQAFVLIGDAMSNLMGIARGIMDIFTPILGLITDLGPAGAAAAAAFLALVMPFGKIRGIMIAAGLLVALEDIGAWMKGQPSLIGRLLGPYEAFAEAVAEWVEYFGGLENVVLGLVALKFAPWLFAVARGVTALAGAMGILGGGAAAKGTGVLAALAGISGAAIGGALLSFLPTAAGDGTAEGTFGEDGEIPEVTQADIDAEYRRAMGVIDGTGAVFDPSHFGMSSPGDLMEYMDNNGSGNSINMDVTQNITVPPGTTAEQLAIIRRESESTIAREIDRAVKALED